MYCNGNLLITISSSCQSPLPTIHCCKHPCFVRNMEDDYLYALKGRHLYLNMVDTYTDQVYFNAMMVKAKEFYALHESIHVHCNKGQSRSPSVALILMYGDLPFHEAIRRFKSFYPAYRPCEGILRCVVQFMAEDSF